jgi:hypothetical protein
MLYRRLSSRQAVDIRTGLCRLENLRYGAARGRVIQGN